jgi:hypothetical protein
LESAMAPASVVHQPEHRKPVARLR